MRKNNSTQVILIKLSIFKYAPRGCEFQMMRFPSRFIFCAESNIYWISQVLFSRCCQYISYQGLMDNNTGSRYPEPY